MASPGSFELDTKTIGALPIVNHLLDRLRFEHFLGKHLSPPDPRSKLAPLKSLGLFLRNLVLARAPIYSLEEWVTSVKYFFPSATIKIPVTFFSPCSGFLLSGSSHPDLFLGFRLRPPLC